MRRWLLAALLAPPARAALSCVDEDGTPVDWWFLYKQPRWADKGRQEPTHVSSSISVVLARLGVAS